MFALQKENFKHLLPALQAIDLNTLFARSVLEGRVDGTTTSRPRITP